MNPTFHPQSVCPSANLPSFHLPHTETHQWGPHPSSFLRANYTLHRPPISHWGTRFFIFTLLPHYSLFIVQMPLFLVVALPFLSSPLVTCFPLPASSISSEYPTGHLPLPSEFFHLVPLLAQLIPGLVVPLTLDLVEWLRPLFISHILQPRAVLSLPTS
jgi:hypothetical protein